MPVVPLANRNCSWRFCKQGACKNCFWWLYTFHAFVRSNATTPVPWGATSSLFPVSLSFQLEKPNGKSFLGCSKKTATKVFSSAAPQEETVKEKRTRFREKTPRWCSSLGCHMVCILSFCLWLKMASVEMCFYVHFFLSPARIMPSWLCIEMFHCQGESCNLLIGEPSLPFCQHLSFGASCYY